MENHWDLEKAVHLLAQMENLYHLEKEVLVTLVLADLVISVDLVDHHLNKKKLQERLLRQL